MLENGQEKISYFDRPFCGLSSEDYGPDFCGWLGPKPTFRSKKLCYMSYFKKNRELPDA